MISNHRKPTVMMAVMVAVMLATGSPASAAAIFNVTIDHSAAGGEHVGLAFDFTANAPPSSNFVVILNFATNGTMGLLQSQGGLVTGDLVLGLNPAPFTTIAGGSFFNEALVTLDPSGTKTTFILSLTENPPPPQGVPDSFAFFLLDANGLPLFPTSDPLGSNALFTFDFTGPGGALSVYGPSKLNGNNITIVVPGPGGPIPEPSNLVLLACGAAAAVIRWRRRRGQS